MYCAKCLLTLPYKEEAKITHCTLCGDPMHTSVRDVLELGKYGLTKEIRPSQIALAEEIERLLQEDNGVALIEGGTGLGKSFAYLLPILLSSKPGMRAVISTAKKTLQDQLALKDLPHIARKIIGEDCDLSKVFTLYKGKSNYACWRMKKSIPAKDRKAYETFIRDARTRQQPADMANWKGPLPSWWSTVSIENCTLGNNCPDDIHCKPHPEKVPIIVTNHHLTALDSMLGGGALLGPYNILIFDEAHQVPDAFRAAYEAKATKRGVKRLVSLAANSTPFSVAVDELSRTNVNTIVSSLKDLSNDFGKLLSAANNAKTDSGLLDPITIDDEARKLQTTANNLINALVSIQHGLQRHRTRQNQNEAGDFEESDHSDISIGELTAALAVARMLTSQVNGLVKVVDSALELGHDTETNLLATATPESINIRPIETAGIIGPKLPAQRVAFLSATLALGKDFRYVRQSFGIDPAKYKYYRELIYPSPFDYSIQKTLLYIPQHLPVPAHAGMRNRRDEWLTAVAKEIRHLVLLTKGNAFVLCSARADMDALLDIIPYKFWESNGLHAVAQDGPASATLSEYLSKPGGVLFGLKSFWEGVDVPGNKLRMVIVPKLPFPHFKDPLITALCDRAKLRGGSPFFEVQVPLMTFDMKQGLGRLIRTANDRGIAAILDPRVWSATSPPDKHDQRMKLITGNDPRYRGKRMGYGRDLLNALPFQAPTHDFNTVQKAAKYYFNLKS